MFSAIMVYISEGIKRSNNAKKLSASISKKILILGSRERPDLKSSN